MKVNTTKLFENFIDIKNTANVKLLACYKKLFTKDGIKSNIAFYITIPIIIFHIVVIFIFYFGQNRKISNIIEDISFGISNWEILKDEERKEKIRKRKELLISSRNKKVSVKNLNDKINNKTNINNRKEIINNETKNEIKNEIKNDIKNEIKNDINQEKEEQKVEKIEILNPIDYYFLTEVLNKQQPPKKIKGKIKENKNAIVFMKSKNNKNLNRKNTINQKNLKEILIKTKKVMEYNDYEKNSLTYELALKYDRRTFIELYISLLKTNHLFIFSFLYNNDYNSKIIKIDLFFINFMVNYAVNALFFNIFLVLFINVLCYIYKYSTPFN